MDSEALQPKALLAHPQALAQHIRRLVATNPSIEIFNLINSSILDQVHTEAVHPSVFAVWISVIYHYSPQVIVSALRDPSYGVRNAAIKLVRRKLIRASHWKEGGWDVLGGAQGIKNILDQLPLVQVKLLVQAIFGRCDHLSDRDLVSACVEEFLALVNGTNGWSARSLEPHVSFLSAYCSAQRVEHLVRTQWTTCTEVLHHIARFHTPLLRQIGVGALEMPNYVRQKILSQCLNSLLKSKEAYEPIYYRGNQLERSPGLVFGIDLLMAMQKDAGQHSHHDLCSWGGQVLDKAIREKQPFESILLILNQGLALLQASASARPRVSSAWLSQSLFQCIIQFWSISRFGEAVGLPTGVIKTFKKRYRTEALAAHQKSLEQCLIHGLLENEDENVKIKENASGFHQSLVTIVALVAQKGRLEFLQLLCRHSPSLGFDLKAWPPSKKEEEYMTCWDLRILSLLPPGDSQFLFRRSLHIHHCDEFLPSSSNKGQSPQFPSWEAQCILWATWESAYPKENGFSVTRKVLDEMKKKSMRGREPPERLRWAEGAIDLAARTKSVDIFVEVVEWSKRFMRDPLVFPNLITKTISSCSTVLSLSVDYPEVTSLQCSWLLQEVQTGNKLLEDLLKTCLLLLREPWTRPFMARMIGQVPYMLSNILGHRMKLARKQPCSKSVPNSEVAEILLDSMIPILIDYEREANKEGQTGLPWSGPFAMIIKSDRLVNEPNLVELSFLDRLAEARDELWQQLRVQKDPAVLELSACWPRGLPIQHLIPGSVWLFHTMRHREQAPFLSSKVDQILYSPIATVMHCIKNERDVVGGFVDDLQFIMRASLRNGEREDKVRDVLHVWEYYSQLLKPHPIYLGMFQNWLANMTQGHEELAEVTRIIRPPPSLPARPTISPVPTGSEIIEWDPREGDYPLPAKAHDDENLFMGQDSHDIPCTVLKCRIEGRIPSEVPFVRARVPEPLPKPVSTWSTELKSPPPDSQNMSYSVQDSVVLAALLFLDTFTKTPRLLRTRFPDVGSPRYTPIYLADEFITFESQLNTKEALEPPIRALQKSAKKIPSQILHDLIWSFLDTLKAEPNAPMYPKLLFATLDLIEILLHTDKPQLAIDLLIRLWMEFTNESSLHRKLSLVKLGRILTPQQASEMMRGLASRVCDALQAQNQRAEKTAETEDKPFVKVTTAKMLAQSLAEADFLSQSDQMKILQEMFNSSGHIDIRTAIVSSLMGLVENSDNDEPYRVFASISASLGGPNERAQTTEAEWDLAENKRGPLPYVAPISDQPVLQMVVSNTVFRLPERFRSDYLQNVLLPLLQDSTAQNTRWISAMSARLGFSMTDLNITKQEIGPFIQDLPDRILWAWARYLPGWYLEQCHRTWSLTFVGDGGFRRLDNALATTDDQALKDINVREHWGRILESRRARSPLFNLHRLLDLIGSTGSMVSNGLTSALILEEFAVCAEITIRNPVKYSDTSKKYTVRPNFVLEPLRVLRNSRVQNRSSAANKPMIYNEATDVMRRTAFLIETVRKEGWSVTLSTGYPATLPSKLECDILLLPSPIYNPDATDPASGLFMTALVDLIRQCACDPALLLKLDAFNPVMQEIPTYALKQCSLRLGYLTHREEDALIVTCVRVKLARLLLDRVRSNRSLSMFDDDIYRMIHEWKKSDFEVVRQIGWEC